MLYKNCRELLYHNFNEIQITGDLKYLIKDKEEHDEKELQDHWVDILEEYLTLTNNFEQKKFFRDKAELKHLELKLTILTHLKPIIELKLNEENQKIVDKILKDYRVLDLDQSILATKDDINIKLSKFNLSYNKEEESSTFEDIISALRVNGVNVNRMELTVSEYVALLKQYKNKK